MRSPSQRLSVSSVVPGLLLVFGLLAVVLALPGVAVAAEPSAPQVRDAIQFREDFGFRSDRAYVRRTFDDPDFSDTTWGVPLDAVELADLQQRQEARSLMGDAIGYATNQPDTGGLYIDQRHHGWPVFLFTGDIEAHRSAIDARLPDSVQFTIRKVTRSWAGLLAMQDAIDAHRRELAKAGVTLVSTGPDTIHNTLEVGVLANLGHARQILARYGDGIVVVLEQPSQLDSGLPPTDAIEARSTDTRGVPSVSIVALSFGLFGGCLFAVRGRRRNRQREPVVPND